MDLGAVEVVKVAADPSCPQSACKYDNDIALLLNNGELEGMRTIFGSLGMRTKL